MLPLSITTMAPPALTARMPSGQLVTPVSTRARVLVFT